MSFRKSRPVTAANLAANRQNAQKSTGPRTAAGKRRASLNGYQHGLYATLDSQRREALEELRDDPGDFERLHQNLFAAWKPADAMQALVVADLADLYWKKLQLENTALHARLREKQYWDCDAEDRTLRSERVQENVGAIVTNSGYRGAVHSKACFDQACLWLDKIEESLNDHQQPDLIRDALNQLYGQSASERGRVIIRLFKQFTADIDGTDPSLAGKLKVLLAAERATIIQEHNLARRREREALRESKPSLWEPGTPNWNLIVGMQSDLDREITQKVKLLIQLRSLAQTGDGPETPREEGSEPVATDKSPKPGSEPAN